MTAALSNDTKEHVLSVYVFYFISYVRYDDPERTGSVVLYSAS
jgi:hypothetical protein